MWSTRRLPDRLEPTEFARRLERRCDETGDALLDLTRSNPTQLFPEHRRRMRTAWRRAADRAGARAYDPVPFGLPEARSAVASYHGARGGAPPIERVVLTASTSEAYAWLAKLLADPGGEVLVPSPSYPLFEHLLRLECLEILRYDYRFDGSWHLDIGDLRRRLDAADDPRAIFGVSPNNPTGHVLAPEEFDALAELADAHSAAVVVDEVFVDFGLDTAEPESVVSKLGERDSPPLTVVLSGLSKTAGLPGAKLGWMTIWGADAVVEAARGRLEFIADNYLSASTPAQLLTSEILGDLDGFHRTVRKRTRSNLAALRESFERLPSCEIRPAEAGWYAVARIPGFVDAEKLVLELVSERDLLVQPGFFYDFRSGEHLVVSLLPPSEEFDPGAERLADALGERTGG